LGSRVSPAASLREDSATWARRRCSARAPACTHFNRVAIYGLGGAAVLIMTMVGLHPFCGPLQPVFGRITSRAVAAASAPAIVAGFAPFSAGSIAPALGGTRRLARPGRPGPRPPEAKPIAVGEPTTILRLPRS